MRTQLRDLDEDGEAAEAGVEHEDFGGGHDMAIGQWAIGSRARLPTYRSRLRPRRIDPPITQNGRLNTRVGSSAPSTTGPKATGTPPQAA